MGSHLAPRKAAGEEVGALAELWHRTWHEAHDQLLPKALVDFRTKKHFETRLAERLDAVTVIGPVGSPIGLCICRDGELEQLFVSAMSRRAGVAAALLDDAEAQMRQKGLRTAWLTCAIGNDRAAAYYVKQGWHFTGVVTSRLAMGMSILPLDVWRFEKVIASSEG